jgi:hypothetical protein
VEDQRGGKNLPFGEHTLVGELLDKREKKSRETVAVLVIIFSMLKVL